MAKRKLPSAHPDGGLAERLRREMASRGSAETARVRAVEALRQREALVEGLYRATPAGMGLVVHRVLEEVNDHLCEMTGHAREELIGQDARILYPTEDDYEYVGREKYAQIARTGFASVETRFRRKNGTVFDVLLRSAALDGKDLSAGVAFTALDITPRKRTKMALTESEQRYRSLAESIGDVFFALDEYLMCTHWNRAAEALTGIPAAAAVGRSFYELFPDTQGSRAEDAFQEVLRTHEPTSFRTEFRFGSEESYCEISVYPAADGVTVFARDVTRTHIAERELRQERDRAQQYLTVAAVVMLALDTEGRVTMVNDKGCEVLGRSRRDIVGKNWFDTFLAERERPEVRRIFADLLAGKEQLREFAEGHVVTPEGERVIAWHHALIRDDEGEILGTLSSGEDITQRRRAREQLRRSEKRLELAIEGSEAGVWDQPLGPERPAQHDDRIYLSPGLKRLAGYENDELPNSMSAWQALQHPEDLTRIRRIVGDHFAGRTDRYDVEYRLKHKDGSWRWIHSRGGLIRDERGRPVRWTGVDWDITERCQAEAERTALGRAARAFVELRPEQDIWAMIADQARAMAGDAVAAVNQIANDTLRVRAVVGLAADDRQAVERLLGTPLEAIALPGIPEEARKSWATGVLTEVPGGLGTAMFGQVPPEPCERISRRLGICRVYSVGLRHGERLLGSITLFTRTKAPLSARLFESFAAQASVAVERQSGNAAGEAEKRFRLVTEAIEDVFWMSTPGVEEMLYISSGYEKLWQHSRESLYRDPKSFLEAVHPDDRQALREAIEKYHSKGRPYECDYRIVRKGGQVRWIHERGYPVPDPSGKVKLMSGTCTDITERKQAEQEVRETQRRYREVFQGSRDGFVMVSASGRIIDANDAYCRMLGYNLGELRRMADFYEITPARWREWEQREIWEKRLLKRGYSGVYQKEYIRKDGTVFPVELQAYAVRDEAGELQYLWGVARDITERYETRKRLEDMAKFPAENPHPVLRVGADGALLFANRAAAPLLQAWNIRIGNPLPESWRRHVEEALKSASAHEVEFKVSGRTYAVILAPVAAGGYVNLYARDVTAREQAEARFVQAQKMEAIGRLAAGIAHDFNNQLTVVRGYCDLLREQEALDDSVQQMVEEVWAAGERAAELTESLLAFSRQQELDPKPLNLNEAVERLHKPLARMLGGDIRLETVLDPDLDDAMIDRGRLEQALMNLAVNARDAMPDGGRLTLETANVELSDTDLRGRMSVAPGRYVLLAVADTGHGMDSYTVSQIFEPFFTTKGVGQGTGLGLAMVYGFVEQSGGHIRVESAPGRGTSFRLYLPTARG